MTCNILCPGPSLARWQEFRPADITIGVNRAALAHDCDYWAAMDDALVMLVRDQVKGSPFLLTVAATVKTLMHVHKRPWQGRVVMTEDIRGQIPRPRTGTAGDWLAYSATAALVFAICQGATDIAVYGADWTPAPDWDGTDLASNRRDDARWVREAAIWQEIIEFWAAPKRATVARMAAPATVAA